MMTYKAAFVSEHLQLVSTAKLTGSMSMSTVDNWKDFEFADLQHALDEQSSKINASQEEGAASRKALSAKTKAFRKLADEEKLGEMRGLLKGYQAEIDSLTTRCKFAEACFMNVYRSLALLPDPEPLLNAKQVEIEKLQSELSLSPKSSEQDSTLARELERQTTKVAQLERQLRGSTPKVIDTDSVAGNSLEGDSKLRRRINELETEAASQQAQLMKTQAEQKEQSALIQKYKEELSQVLAQLAVRQDYDAIKDELSRLKERELTSGDLGSRDSHAGNGSSHSDRDVVAQHRLVGELQTKNHALQEQNSNLASEIANCKTLIAKLEDDLTAVQPSDTFSTISGWTAVPRGGPGSTLGGASMQGGPAISNVIVQQRDRYKKRMQELEEKSHVAESKLALSQKELEAVKRESFTLYDRIRQLQALSPSTGTNAPTPLAKASTSLYEPLPEQQMKELDIDRRIIGLSPVNAKLVELAARAVVDQKFRIGVASYAAAVHVLVLLGVLL